LNAKPAFARLRRGRLSGGRFGCGDDLVEALITAQIVAHLPFETCRDWITLRQGDLS